MKVKYFDKSGGKQRKKSQMFFMQKDKKIT